MLPSLLPPANALARRGPITNIDMEQRLVSGETQGESGVGQGSHWWGVRSLGGRNQRARRPEAKQTALLMGCLHLAVPPLKTLLRLLQPVPEGQRCPLVWEPR